MALPCKLKNADVVKFLEGITLEELQAFMAPVRPAGTVGFWDNVTVDALVHGNETTKVRQHVGIILSQED